MRVVELTSGSLAELLSAVESQPGSYRHLFRGQSDAAWGIVPSLYRVQHLGIAGGTLEENYNLFEANWVKRFFDDGLPYLPAITRSYSNDRILAQHFGLPTRFLDWSRDPLVAAFFAVESPHNTDDSAIFMILPDANHLPEEVRSLGPHKAIALRPPAIDARITAQKSMFTFHPYGDDPNQPFVPLDERPDMGNQITTKTGVERGFAKIIIPARWKRFLRDTLFSMGYDRRNLFPGLDGVGADARARARTGVMPH